MKKDISGGLIGMFVGLIFVVSGIRHLISGQIKK